MKAWVWRTLLGASPLVIVIIIRYVSAIRRRTYIRGEKVDEIEVARKRYEMKRGKKSKELTVLPYQQSESFQHQVAGHFKEVLRKHKDMILKPLNKTKLFLRELRFYERWAQYGSISSQFPHPFLPKYYGVVMCENSNGGKVPYLALENVTLNYSHPCVIDIKMGRQTFEPTASQDKMEREKNKYPHQSLVGFRITGFKVYDSITGKYFEVRKEFGRGLTPDLVKTGLASFFHNGTSYRLDIIHRVIQYLEILLQWITIQKSWSFYCSSILIVYNAEKYIPVDVNDTKGYQTVDDVHFLEKCINLSENQLSQQPSQDSLEITTPPNSTNLCRCSHKLNRYQYTPYRDDKVEVKMIDHAHTLESKTIDESYIYSLTSLISYLKEMYTDIRNGNLDEIDLKLGPILKKGTK